jgi:hypothetical protein
MELHVKHLKLTFDDDSTLEGDVQGTLTLVVPEPPPVSDYIEVWPGDSIQAAVDTHPEGTKFQLNPGVHKQQQVIPKTGNVFQGEPGAILDGENVAQHAFRTGNPPYPANVTIRGLEIRNYASPDQRAAVEAGLYSTSDASEGWVIVGCEVHHNACIGIRLGNRCFVQGNYVHHNHCLNMGGSGDEALVEGNRIEYGNFEYRYVPGDQAGGCKFCACANLTVRGNTFFKNSGPSLWCDENAIDMRLEANTIDDGDMEGLVIEICYRATIVRNTVTNCGWRDPGGRYDWLWNAGIAVHSSPDCEVFENQVANCWSGIVAHQQDRYTNEPNPPVYGDHIVSNLYVHDNFVDQKTEPQGSEVAIAAGLADDAGNQDTFNARNNRFLDNIYTLSGPNRQPFAWMNSTCSEDQWHDYGQQ